MGIKEHTKSFSKLKPLILTLVFVFMVSLSLNMIPTLEVQAGYDFDEGDPTAKGSNEILGGPTWARTGTIFYLVDEYGRYVKQHPIGYTTSYEGIVDRNGVPLSKNNIRVSARLLTLKPKQFGVGAVDRWGAPFDSDANFRGVEIREWLLESADNGHKRAANLIREHWGEECARRWEQKEYYLVFEGFEWNNVYCQGKNTGFTVAGTSVFWGSYQYYLEAQGLTTPTGDPKISRYTNGIYPHCMLLTGSEEIEKMGLKPAPSSGGLEQNREMARLDNGWGIGVVWNDLEAINTYDEKEGSPGYPENPKPDKVGDCMIVKGYYTEDLDTGKKKSDGVFVREGTSNIINIMSEPEYELVQWDISTTKKKNMNPLAWEPPSGGQRGLNPTQVKLKEPEKAVYVLLKRVIEKESEDINADWILSESRLTRHVKTEKTDRGEDKLSGCKFIVEFGELRKSHTIISTYEYVDEDGKTQTGTREEEHKMELRDEEVKIGIKNDRKEGALISILSGETWGDKS